MELDITNQIQTHILNHLINDEEYCRRVIPFLKKDYFEGTHRVVFDLIVDFVTEHNKIPSGKVLELELKKLSAPEEVLTQSVHLINELVDRSDIDIDSIWNDIETHSDNLKINHSRWPFTDLEKKRFICPNCSKVYANKDYVGAKKHLFDCAKKNKNQNHLK